MSDDKPTNTLELVKHLDEHPDLLMSFPEPCVIAGVTVPPQPGKRAVTFDYYADGLAYFLDGRKLWLDRSRPFDPDCEIHHDIEFDDHGFTYRLQGLVIRLDYYRKPQRKQKPRPVVGCPRCGRTLDEIKRAQESPTAAVDYHVCLVCLAPIAKKGDAS